MLRLDATFPTIEQEAPHVSSPRRAVEVFTHQGHVYLRVGPVEGDDPAHGSYTLLLSDGNAAEIAAALSGAARELATDAPGSAAADDDTGQPQRERRPERDREQHQQ